LFVVSHVLSFFGFARGARAITFARVAATMLNVFIVATLLGLLYVTVVTQNLTLRKLGLNFCLTTTNKDF
jgi:hypothetical protein